MARILIILTILVLASCKGPAEKKAEEAYRNGYEDGYEEGLRRARSECLEYLEDTGGNLDDYPHY